MKNDRVKVRRRRPVHDAAVVMPIRARRGRRRVRVGQWPFDWIGEPDTEAAKKACGAVYMSIAW